MYVVTEGNKLAEYYSSIGVIFNCRITHLQKGNELCSMY